MPYLIAIILAALAGTGTATALAVEGGLGETLMLAMGASVGFAVFAATLTLIPKKANSVKIDEMERVKAQTQRLREDVQALRDRLDVLDAGIERQVNKRNDAIMAEVRVLEDLLERLSRTTESKLASLGNQQTLVSQTSAMGPQAGPERDNIMGVLRHALERNMVDVHLQPIVTLPQRRISYYEAFTRVRDPAGRVLTPSEFWSAAESAGVVGVIDNMLLFRCVQIVRRLAKQDRRIGVFCNISSQSLRDEQFFPQFLEFMTENQDLAGSVIFEITQAAFDARNGVEARNMSRLTDLGYRFSIDRATRIDIDLPELQKAGVRYFKIAGYLLVDQLTKENSRPQSAILREVEPRDVSALFARYGLDIIADRVEEERTVVEILDLDIAYGQGHLFGQPKPAREDGNDPAPPNDAEREINPRSRMN